MPSVMYTECHKLGFYAECYYNECRYTECRGAFAIANHSYHSLIFAVKARSYKVKPLFRLHSIGRILDIPTNIILGWKLMCSDEHTILLLFSRIHYECKKYYSVEPWFHPIQINIF
jgi:hypothetical protein